jgi:hypothetical protein
LRKCETCVSAQQVELVGRKSFRVLWERDSIFRRYADPCRKLVAGDLRDDAIVVRDRGLVGNIIMYARVVLFSLFLA